MKTILLYTALMTTTDGAAVSKLSQEFATKSACTDAITADSGRQVDVNAAIPTLQLDITTRYSRYNPESNYQRWVCVPKGE
ncbi:TPA: hypothetical protein ACGW3M_000954 [Pseudomonas aeruginosa]|uniref:hypothetical protein n=1 Tax=Pseudomonas aeruginosa TaxID=287 RepID=UPI0027E89BA5|nr:hypothetical protein [Pseudomonas aeruginosa]EKY4113706.1 hypothetical protein [Pseudomonas aeruginosa]ELJ2276228.1 hypothetical protein [Pseudomonas aeruginosa]MBX6653694.1 hypothetical protein [Pseudomonas aeruginosa]MCS8413343.1 hypothetical protein [Pseudomonas aeruginosa]